MASRGIFIPQNTQWSESDVWSWYSNITIECESIAYSEREIEELVGYYQGAGLLTKWRKPFFRRHYSSSFVSAANFLVGDRYSTRILDVGCGVGTQTLFFALLGHTVLALDVDAGSLNILRKRQKFYEECCGKKLDIIYLNENALDVDFKAIGPINGIHSMFAFNMIQPSSKLLDNVLSGTADRARIAVIDGNCASWVSRIFPHRRREVWSPFEFSAELRRRGFFLVRHKGGTALPPLFFAIAPLNIPITWIDNQLCRSWKFAVSHQIFAEKCVH